MRQFPASARRLFLRERPVVLLDRLAEAVRHLIGSGERQRIVPCLRLAAQHELELLQLVDRRGLELLEPFRIGVHAVVVERFQVSQDFVEVARAHAGLLELPAQRLSVIRPLAELPAELADVVRVPAVGVAVAATPVARVAAVRAAVRTAVARRPGVVAVVRAAAAVLSDLGLLPLALLPLLTLFALLPFALLLALLTLLARLAF